MRGVVWTTGGNRGTDPPLESCSHLSPERYPRERLGIADDVKPISSSAAGDVDSVGCLEKARFVTASHGAEDDHFGLFTLEIVDGRNPKHVGD